MKFKKSRLQKIEERKSVRQAFLFLFLTIVLLVVIFLLGIPLLIKATVLLGNLRNPNQAEQTGQKLLPTQPRLLPIPTATNSSQLLLSGFAMADTQVKIYLNNNIVKDVTSDKNGEFSNVQINLKEGDNLIKVTSISDGKESEPYTVTLIYTNKPPALEITSPENNASFFDQDNIISIEGKTDSGVSIVINGHLASVDQDGKFTLKITLSEGNNIIKVVAQDEAGNQAEKEINVTYSP